MILVNGLIMFTVMTLDVHATKKKYMGWSQLKPIAPSKVHSMGWLILQWDGLSHVCSSLGDGAVQGWKLHSVVLVGPFQLILWFSDCLMLTQEDIHQPFTIH